MFLATRVATRGAAQYPTVHRTVPTTENDGPRMSAVSRLRGPGSAQGLTLTPVLVQIKEAEQWGSAWGRALTNHLQALFGVLGIDGVELLLEFYDLLCLNGDVCGLALGNVPRRRLEPVSAHSGEGCRWGPGSPLWILDCQWLGRWVRALNPSTPCFILTAIRKASWIKYIILLSVSGPH